MWDRNRHSQQLIYNEKESANVLVAREYGLDSNDHKLQGWGDRETGVLQPLAANLKALG